MAVGGLRGPLAARLSEECLETQCGRLCFGRRKINLSQVFAGQAVGVREVTDHIWLISFTHYDLGFFDDQCTRVECAPNPFSAKVSAVFPV
ncbi:MAG: hypothetical protein WAU56_07195 [Steroidobacteraceae bacterium]